jgi:UTP-glucose-1-phosphate uridylyltransferase
MEEMVRAVVEAVPYTVALPDERVPKEAAVLKRLVDEETEAKSEVVVA